MIAVYGGIGMRIILALALFTCASFAEAKIAIPTRVSVEALPEGSQTRPVQLSRVIVKLNRGEAFGRLKGGLLCIAAEPLIWKGGRVQLNTEDFSDIFKDELEKLGFTVVSTFGNLFDTGEQTKAEFLVGGTIKTMMVDMCFPNSGFGDLMSSKGAALMEVEWQVYNRLDRVVVDSFTSRTGVDQPKAQSGGLEGIVFAAFAENVRALAASGKLQKLLVGQATALDVARKPASDLQLLQITLPSASLKTIENAVGATVVIQSGDGHGSGFLISPEGYFLTNYHVVGGGKYVKVRWSDGVESLGEVVRIDRGRDIALIKADARNRAAIKLANASVPPGSDVFAIGAPLDRQLQNTVTKGVISANRVLDGYNYVQSDVSVLPGNSGGPLIDKNGDLIGITVSGLRINDAPQGVNFFIPAAEALDFLGIVHPR